MAVRRKLIRQLVEKLLREHNVNSAPVNVDKIARAFGIFITRDRVHQDISGFLFKNVEGDKKVVIGTNESHHANRQRFTIAHELGHFLLHEGEIIHLDTGYRALRLNLRDSMSSKGEDNNEKEANLFAAELLMPAAFIAKDIRDLDLDLFDDNNPPLQRLAKKYQVSAQALTFRLANLGYIRL